MRKVENGSSIKICYTGRLENGEVFDRTDSCQPLAIVIGAGEMVQGLEDALIGMGQNEKKTVSLSPDEAFGVRDERLMRTLLRSNFPSDYQPEIGSIVAMKTPHGEQLPGVITELDGEYVKVDFNHPLAGKPVVYEVEIAEIADPSDPLTSACESGCCCSS